MPGHLYQPISSNIIHYSEYNMEAFANDWTLDMSLEHLPCLKPFTLIEVIKIVRKKRRGRKDQAVNWYAKFFYNNRIYNVDYIPNLIVKMPYF